MPDEIESLLNNIMCGNPPDDAIESLALYVRKYSWKPISEAPKDEWVMVYTGKAQFPSYHVAMRQGSMWFTDDDSTISNKAITLYKLIEAPKAGE